MALEAYRNKRHFDKTPEPAGDVPSGGEAAAATGTDGESGRDVFPGQKPLLYLIQKHAARRLHYDFRLELDGVLLSWAVPKGPSLDPKERHLATRVEDHPLEYGNFEGTIPRGEYGGGTVQLWDRGWWEPEGDPHEGLRRGDLKFTLHGEKLKGSWVLVRMKARPGEENKENWLLIKHRDEEAVDGDGQRILAEMDRSVASGRTLEEIAEAGEASVWHSDLPIDQQTEARAGEEFAIDPSALRGAREGARMPRFIRPELATLVKRAPEGEEWLHEVKFDGYRALSRIENGRVEMYSRNDKEWTGHYRLLADELAQLPVESAMLDGEVVVQMPDGTTDFQELQNYLGTDKVGRFSRDAGGASPAGNNPDGGAVADSGSGEGRLLYYVFDLLYLNGYELLDTPLEERKELLRRLLSRSSHGRILYSEHLTGEGPSFVEEACRHGLEGVVSKKAGSRYRPGARGSEWLKTKCWQEQEFVIGGYTDPAGTRIGFGALLLGVHKDGKLSYVGKVGTGFNERMLRDLGERLREIETEDPPFDGQGRRAPRGAHWVRPELVAEVAFSEWTRDGDIRHPSFKGLRADKPPAEVEVEEPLSEVPEVADGGGTAPPGGGTDPPGGGTDPRPRGSGVDGGEAASEDGGGRQTAGPVAAGQAGADQTAAGRAAADQTVADNAAAGQAADREAGGSSGTGGGMGSTETPRGGRARQTPAEEVNGVKLTHPGKMLWPIDGITKRGLVDHYRLVAERMLPYVLGRPIAMVRCPEGVKGVSGSVRQGRGRGAPCFFHKHPGNDFPGPFERVKIRESAGPETYLTITEPGSLTALAQMGVLEIHLWGSTWPEIEHPDMLVFDLDPDPAVTWEGLADAARLMRDVLRALGLESFLKTTGGKGLHVQAPIRPTEDWQEVRAFCKGVAEAFVAHAPDRYTANMSKAKRGGKIYVDYVRNNRGATSIAPYSTRAKDHATVSVPLRWGELRGSVRPDSYTVKNLGNRVRRLKGDPWEGWFEIQQSQTISEAMKRALASV